MSRYIVPLDRRRARDVDYAGGKGASLAQLTKLGYLVPKGFVISSGAFRHHLAILAVTEIAQKKQWLKSELALIRTFIQDNPMPRPLEHAILKAVRQLRYPVAVRSSMVGEDAASASFAGQLDTVLHVKDDVELIRAVKQCWASVFNWRLVTYLSKQETVKQEDLLSTFSIAVVVQEMVRARAAGVAFSVDPVSGQDRVVIEAVPGFGDALVDGRAEPDRYLVSNNGDVVQVEAAGDREPALSTVQAAALAQIVRQVQGTMDAPQDVEWAWDGEDFHLLQSRPITSLAGAHVYSTSMVSEMLPGLIKPLVWSVSAEAKLQHVMGRIFTELTGPNDIDYTKLAKRIHGRIYADNTLLASVLERMGLPPNFFEMMSRDEHATRHQRPPINLSTLRTMLRIGRFITRHARIADKTEAYLSSHAEALAHYQDSTWEAASPQELLERLGELRALYNESLWMNFIGPVNMMLRNMLLGHLVRLWSSGTSTNDLVRGLVGMKALDSNRGLGFLAGQARSLGPEIVGLLGEGDIPTIRSALSATAGGRAFLGDVDQFLERYGFLNAVGTDLSRTPWIEDPIVIWRAIARRALAADEQEPDDMAAIRAAAQTKARAGMRRWQHVLFGRILKATIRYIDLRERTSVLISQDSYQLRRILLALADQFVARAALQDREDIFYLEMAEVEQLVNGTLEGDRAQELVAIRRQELAAAADLELPDTIYGDIVPAAPITLADNQTSLSGISGCSGVAQGQARIVLDPSQAPVSLTHDDILIVPFTDVSWTPLFAGIGGLIAETGGQLSHSAIIAREFGLPAVVNVKQATRLIREGQTVVVDGDRGCIYLH